VRFLPVQDLSCQMNSQQNLNSFPILNGTHLLGHSRDGYTIGPSPDLFRFGWLWPTWWLSSARIFRPGSLLVISVNHLRPRPISEGASQATLVCGLGVIDEEGTIKNFFTSSQIRISQEACQSVPVLNFLSSALI